MYVYVFTPFRVLLLVYKPEGGGLISCNNTIKGVIKCLLPLLCASFTLLSNSRARVKATWRLEIGRAFCHGEGKTEYLFEH